MNTAVPILTRRRGKIVASGGVGLAVGVAMAVFVAPPVFRSAALVGIEDAVGRFHADVVRSAADLATSRPVLVRAAASLVDTHVMGPAPGIFDRFGPSGKSEGRIEQAARLADQLHVHVAPGLGAAALDITAEAPDAAQAAQVATAVANALVAYRDDVLAEIRQSRNKALSSRLAALRNTALAAHQHLAALAGTETDPASARLASAEQASAAEARVASLRAIVASGTPPLGSGKDMPQSVEVLQSTYLDLSRKLAVASETLGDRHTTIITLQDGVRRAATALTAEWKRLLRIAEADLAAARQHDAALGKTDAVSDPSRLAAVDDARRTAQAADDAVIRAEGQREAAGDEQGYRLIAPAPVPLSSAAGFSLAVRVAMALAAGLAASGFAMLLLSWMRPIPTTEFASSHEEDMAPSDRSGDPTSGIAGIVARVPIRSDADVEASEAAMSSHAMSGDMDPLVHDALGEIVDDVVMAEPAVHPVPTLMVAANDGDRGTLDVAMTLAELAIERGMRVLLVEGPRAQPRLAALAEPDGEPMLIDLFDILRIGLRSETDDNLTVVPFFKHGANIAAALARNAQADLLDDAADHFDIIIIDGACAADSAAAGLCADAYLRVGRFASRRETSRFLTMLDVPDDRFLGTLAGTAFVPQKLGDREPRRHDSWRQRSSQPVTSAPAPFSGRPGTAQQANAVRTAGSQAKAARMSTGPAYSRRASVR